METSPQYSVSFVELEDEAGSEAAVIIDVRNPSEVAGGRIDAKRWLNVPLGELENAFLLPDDEFESKYKGKKPSKNDDKIILHCRTGIRSTNALKILQALGFTQTKHFPGGYERWKREKQT